MYDNHSHSCQDRIVSLEQPHVRPIQRGKRPYPTEFGQKLHLSAVDGYTYLEQTSWNNFNEGCDLEAAVEDYARKFGCCPSAVLADRIYQARANKLYCKELGIRLSGPPLGRRKANQTDAKIKRQMYCDSCERNAVEGRSGNAKRRFGLAFLPAVCHSTYPWPENVHRLSGTMFHSRHSPTFSHYVPSHNWTESSLSAVAGVLWSKSRNASKKRICVSVLSVL